MQCLTPPRLPQSKIHPLLFFENNTKQHEAEPWSCMTSFLLTVPEQSYHMLWNHKNPKSMLCTLLKMVWGINMLSYLWDRLNFPILNGARRGITSLPLTLNAFSFSSIVLFILLHLVHNSPWICRLLRVLILIVTQKKLTSFIKYNFGSLISPLIFKVNPIALIWSVYIYIFRMKSWVYFYGVLIFMNLS